MSGGIRNGLHDMVMRLTSDPDGVVVAPMGTLAIDTTTGVTWRNRSGSTIWDPANIPVSRGWLLETDLIPLILASSGSPWSSNIIGGGTNAFATSTAANPGVITLGASAAGVDAAYLRAGGTTGLLFGAGRLGSRQYLRVPTLSNGTNNVIARVGMHDIVAIGDATDGAYLEYDFATYGDHRLRLCAASNGTPTKADTGIALVANTWTQLEVFVNAAGTSVTARIGGVAAASAVTSNIPTGAGRNFYPGGVFVQKQLGAGALSVDVDWLSAWGVLTADRM
jgi:hypothetical protein